MPNSPNEPPVITSNGGGATAALSLAERTLTVTAMTASDPDIGDTITWSIVGGADAALFDIDPVTGLLSFKSAPANIAPADVGANNVYDVIVRSSDGSLFAEQAIAVSVLDGPDSYSGTGGDDVFLASDASNWTILGQGGNDTLIGNGGDDVIDGGAVSDVLVGG